ncbi:unnamed protein product [Rhizophagus irregularis]|uniref:MIR domain-containing protein n=1 Tax=Rhizophagus irregularis TaxID=588596 RepID=A0A915Z0C9_9GLOM|nr:unnamed protein product [Rhizophagus irregularis]CAB5355774.1 unnamed protein product [Rhizophagus irregularis]
MNQLAFAGSPEPDLNALWKIEFSGKLPIYGYFYCKSPITEHAEVCCDGNENLWKFKHKVVCHSERLGGNDEWRIELISQD